MSKESWSVAVGTFIALIVAAVFFLAAGSANAQSMPGMVCGKRADIVADLERRYGETRRSYGLWRQQGVVEIWASEKGSWTILLSRPGGIACLMAAGEAYEAEKGGGPETPA